MPIKRTHTNSNSKSHLTRIYAPHALDDIEIQLPKELNSSRTNRTGIESYYRFETLEESLRLDGRRLHGVGEALREVSAKPQRRSLKRLRAVLDYDHDCEPPITRASAAYMRGLRRNLCGELLRLRRESYPDMCGIHLIPNGWEIAPDALTADALRKLLRELVNYLERPEFKGASGFFFAAMDGEYRGRTGMFGPHLHGAVCGDFKEIISKRWKGKVAFRPLRPGAKPIQITKLSEPAAALSYTMKSAWTYRGMIIDGKGAPSDGVKTSKMPEPMQSLYLAALNDLSLGESFIFRGCKIQGGQLVVRS